MASNSNDRVRFRYGMCLNDSCSKAKAKEVQEIPSRKEFVCAECGKALRECPPPKKKKNVGLIVAIVAVVVALGGAGVWLSGGSAPETTSPVKVYPIDSLTAPVPAEEPKEVPPTPESPKKEPKKEASNGPVTKDFGYAVYKGRMKNGKMNDNSGVLTFKEAHIIEPRDVKQRMAQPGEKVIGIFEDGHLVTGTWHKNDGNKELIVP